MRIEQEGLAQALKQQARWLGFPLVGVTTCAPPTHLDIYQNWLASGLHGEMTYLGTDQAFQRRSDPRQILPECRSILVLGIPYSWRLTLPLPSAEKWHGRIAAYAWGNDYHSVLPHRLQALVTWLETRIDRPVPHRCYTDTGPLLERELGQRAGLGWIGRNTCLISPHTGSTFFLAEILLGIELAPDPPFTADHCGSCQRCRLACPTGCIGADRTLDARRCLAYLTIELKGTIPLELRPLIGDWVFGCDICQQVCPWNRRFALQQGDATFLPRAGQAYPDLLAALSLTPQEFNRQFRNTPLQRTRRRGYLRNVATVLGNLAAGSQDPQLLKALQSCQQDAEPVLLSHINWAIEQIQGKPDRLIEPVDTQSGERPVL